MLKPPALSPLSHNQVAKHRSPFTLSSFDNKEIAYPFLAILPVGREKVMSWARRPEPRNSEAKNSVKGGFRSLLAKVIPNF